MLKLFYREKNSNFVSICIVNADVKALVFIKYVLYYLMSYIHPSQQFFNCFLYENICHFHFPIKIGNKRNKIILPLRKKVLKTSSFFMVWKAL